MSAMTDACETATRFAHRMLGDCPISAHRPAADPVCWLCGGATDGRGRARATAIPPTFTNVNLAAAPASTALCEPCAYFGSSETWKAYCAAHPALGLKSVHPLSWRSYSHVFSATGHECPTRSRWRSLLLAPPEPPFLFVLTESGQKHLLFRARVAHSRDVYPIQVEEDRLSIDRAAFAACLLHFERLYALGFSKEQIQTGRYHPGHMAKVGPAAWRAAEAEFAPLRQRSPDLVRVAAFVAQREEDAQRSTASTPTI